MRTISMTTKTYTWSTNPDAKVEPSTVVATFTRVLPDDGSKTTRDVAVMDYLRAMRDHYKAPITADPVELCSLWEWAFFAGQDHAGETIKSLRDEVSKLKAQKPKRK